MSVDWPKELNSHDPNLNLSNLISKANSILDSHASLKKVTLKNNFAKKPWITGGILSSIKQKNKLYHKFLAEKKTNKKETLHIHCKQYRNNLTKITRAGKILYYKTFFLNHKTNLKKAWKGIRTLINCKQKQNASSNSLMSNGSLINNSLSIANCFNEYFSSIAEKTKAKIQHYFQTFL